MRLTLFQLVDHRCTFVHRTAFASPFKLTGEVGVVPPLVVCYCEETGNTVQGSIRGLSLFFKSGVTLRYFGGHIFVIFKPFDLIIFGWKVFDKAEEHGSFVLRRGGWHPNSWQMKELLWKKYKHTKIYMQKPKIIYAEVEENNIFTAQLWHTKAPGCTVSSATVQQFSYRLLHIHWKQSRQSAFDCQESTYTFHIRVIRIRQIVGRIGHMANAWSDICSVVQRTHSLLAKSKRLNGRHSQWKRLWKV